MTEEQLMQRVAENQKRVFNDIDKSKKAQSFQGFQVIGSDGINIQQQGNQVAISADLNGLRGEQGEQGIQGVEGPSGPEGEKGDKGDTGDTGEPGVGISSATVNGDLSFTFTLTNGDTITTNSLLSGDGVLAVNSGSLTVLQTQSCN